MSLLLSAVPPHKVSFGFSGGYRQWGVSSNIFIQESVSYYVVLCKPELRGVKIVCLKFLHSLLTRQQKIRFRFRCFFLPWSLDTDTYWTAGTEKFSVQPSCPSFVVNTTVFTWYSYDRCIESIPETNFLYDPNNSPRAIARNFWPVRWLLPYQPHR